MVPYKYNRTLSQIGDRIVKRRMELGMTANELALYADISAPALSQIENGQRNAKIESLHSIAKALGVSLAQLQPEDLDKYSEVPSEMQCLVKKLKDLDPDKRNMLIKMFCAQIDSL